MKCNNYTGHMYNYKHRPAAPRQTVDFHGWHNHQTAHVQVLCSVAFNSSLKLGGWVHSTLLATCCMHTTKLTHAVCVKFQLKK